MKLFFLIAAIFFSVHVSAQADSITYPVAVAFVSKCCGVPDSKPIVDYVRSFKKKYHLKKISYDHIGPLGKEGEYQMCFSLKELSKKQSAIFISGVKKIVPKMTDQGIAEIEEHKTWDRSSLPGRVQVTKITL